VDGYAKEKKECFDRNEKVCVQCVRSAFVSLYVRGALSHTFVRSYTHAQAGKGNSNTIDCDALNALPKLTTESMLTSYDLMVRVCAVHIYYTQNVWMTSFDSFANRYLLVLLHTHTNRYSKITRLDSKRRWLR
jgi:hypothetical protein